MSDEDEFPDDVFETAYNIADGNHSETELVRMIARAILAERERAAKIADADAASYSHRAADLVDRARAITAEDIAAAIRKGTP